VQGRRRRRHSHPAPPPSPRAGASAIADVAPRRRRLLRPPPRMSPRAAAAAPRRLRRLGFVYAGSCSWKGDRVRVHNVRVRRPSIDLRKKLLLF
jgi:hypothetical protein